MTTPELRKSVLQGDKSNKAVFAKGTRGTAGHLDYRPMQRAQITCDTWVRFGEQYLGLITPPN